MTAWLVLVGSYLLGSLPFSWIVARLFGVADVRSVGSGNVGATNVMRSAGKTAGVLAFVLDFVKGAFAALIAARISPDPWLPSLAAGVAVLGHVYPVWLGFRGGKGVATGAGAFLPLAPVATLVGLLTFPVVLGLSRYVSVASLAGALALAATTWVRHEPEPVRWTAVGVAVLIAWKHRSNLRRIAQGTENRLGRGPRSAVEAG